jgi:hypothetical protein
MSFTAVIDISTFIWSEQDFNDNKIEYVILRNLIPDVFTQIKALKLPILFRHDLQQLILAEFPFKLIEDKEIGYDFYRLTYEFLIDTFSNWVKFEGNADHTIISTPDINKPHFGINIKVEAQSQIYHLFQNSQNTEHKFIAYTYLFKSDNNLVLKNQQETVVVDTLRYGSEEDIVTFFDKFKIKFRHNSKHDSYKSGGKVSPLSCFNERTGDTTKAQALLEKAYQVGNDYYYLDEENNVYVQFVSSNDGTYHGFDVSDEKGNVPSKIKSKFNRNGRIF